MANKDIRNKISQKINLSGTRLKDSEADALFDFVENIDDYSGKSKTIKKSHDGWGSDGKFTRTENWTYTVDDNDAGISIIEEYSYLDDDGASDNNTIVHSTGRAILGLLEHFI